MSITKTEFKDIILNNIRQSINFSQQNLTFSVNNNGFIYYYSNKNFNDFVNHMEPCYYNQYAKGKGSELYPHKHKGILCPPKMACITSSSRFCYLALRKSTSVLGGTGKAIFEKRCSIAGVKNATANLDAHIKDDNVNIYVEAKCQEIFDNHKHELRIPYWNCIYGNIDGIGFNLESTQSKPVDTGKNYFDIPMDILGLNNIERFDFKQFLCHLLGIASQNKKYNKAATLCYMFFKPLSDDPKTQSSIDDIFDNELKDEIKAIFTNSYIQAFCNNNNITLTAIVEEAKVMESLTHSNKRILF